MRLHRWPHGATGQTHGTCGAVISGGNDTADFKIKALQEAGIMVADSPASLGSTMVKALQAWGKQ